MIQILNENQMAEPGYSMDVLRDTNDGDILIACDLREYSGELCDECKDSIVLVTTPDALPGIFRNGEMTKPGWVWHKFAAYQDYCEWVNRNVCS